MSSRLRVLFPITAALLWITTAHAQAPKPAGASKPLAPAEALKQFHLAPGLRMELVACDPQIESPVAMTFDPAGRLWVVEMRDYPNGPPPGKPGQGRIRILQDKDGDGFFEESRVFADELLFANGLLLWKDGVIVTAAPHILFLRDTDGDGKADKREVLYEGFLEANPQLRVSHPVLGMDGWVYVANGLRGGTVKAAGREDAKPINLSGMDFRFNLLTGEHEAITGMGQFGNTFDDWGNRFVCDNRHHLRHVVLENRYLKNNPNLAAPALVEDVSILGDGPLSSGGKIYPLSKNWTTSNLHEGRFTAACGVFVYRGALLPKEYRGAAFTCDPTGNLVHVETLTPKGATFEARPLFKEKEFLATPDDWFRPVFLSHGPDDALYVVDMCRAVIEHPEFMPPELKTRPDLTLGKEKGRIWRIVPEGAKSAAAAALQGKKAEELTALLESANAWERATAFRLLVERGDDDAVGPLRKLLASTEPRARAQAGWLLQVIGEAVPSKEPPLKDEDLVRLLKDAHPRVQEQAVLLVERRKKAAPPVAEALLQLARSPDARLRYQAALTMGMLPDVKDVGALTTILVSGAEDRWTRLAVTSAVPQQAGALAEDLIKAKGFATLPPAPRDLAIRELAALIAARQDPAELKSFVGLLSESRLSKDLPTAGILGLAEGAQRRGLALAALLNKLFPRGDEPERTWFAGAIDVAAKAVTDEKLPLAERLEAVHLIGLDDVSRRGKQLFALLGVEQPMELRLAALRALGRHKNKMVAAELVQMWGTLSPTLRREASEVLLSTPETISIFLDGVARKQIRPAEIDPVRARRLLAHPAPPIRERAKTLLAASLPADRKEALAAYQDALKLAGDAKRGKNLFAKHCITCHKVAGIGIDVGPDISDTRVKAPAALLADILNPNQAIDANYLQYMVRTSDGRMLTGILAAETSSSVTLKRAEGQTDVVLRSEIESVESTGVSLMPDGLERAISVAEMADLLAFLKNWRYLDGAVPLGK